VASLRYKIGFSYLVIVVIGLATSVFAVYNFSSLRDTFGLVLRDNYESVFAAQYMVRALERQENAQLEMQLADIDLAYIKFNNNRVGFLGWLEKAKRAGQNERELAVLERITQDYHRYTQLADSLYRLLQIKGRTTAASDFKSNVIRPVAESLKDECFVYLGINQDAVTRTEEKLNQTASDATLTVITISIVAVFLSFFASVRFTRSIIMPAEKLCSKNQQWPVKSKN
jgi:hypothetical protein